jgi:hypothetical protein
LSSQLIDSHIQGLLIDPKAHRVPGIFGEVAKSLLGNKDTDRKCKIKVYNVYFKKLLLYGAETWTCTKREESKL